MKKHIQSHIFDNLDALILWPDPSSTAGCPKTAANRHIYNDKYDLKIFGFFFKFMNFCWTDKDEFLYQIKI